MNDPVVAQGVIPTTKPTQMYVWDEVNKCPVRVTGNADGSSAQSDAADTLAILRQMLHLLQPLGIVSGAGSNRLQLDVYNVSGGTITTVTTVGTVTNIRDVGTIPNGGYNQMTDLSTMAFQSLRNNIV
jgi:hypothetical protein